MRGTVLRLMEKPTAVPQATGSSIAAAGLEKRNSGRVREGMKVVIVGIVSGGNAAEQCCFYTDVRKMSRDAAMSCDV
jgi:hypothetical protein